MGEIDPHKDDEANRLGRRVKRYASVGANVGGVAARIAGQYIFGAGSSQKQAADLANALGGLKGPLMKVAQFLSTIPDAVPPEFAAELGKLQNNAPPMGWSFVKRRMAAELGPDWQEKFAQFEHKPAASASLGQVHKAMTHDGEVIASKLQYPDMQSAVEADLTQLKVVFSIHKRMSPAVDTSDVLAEISARLREELDYHLEARHMALYGLIFKGDELVKVPKMRPELSTGRLLTMNWLEGGAMLNFKKRPQEERNIIGRALHRAWWYPFNRYGVIHGDPHLGNYTVFCDEQDKAAGINLLDYGCIRTFPPSFVGGVIDLYHGLESDDRDLMVHAYETWGFTGLSNELIDILNIWATFIYGPILEDRVRSLADDGNVADYGRAQAFKVHQALREAGPVKVPREFVFMDRATIGLGGVLLHLGAELNFHQLFHALIEGFTLDKLAARQRQAFDATNVPLPYSAGKV